MPSCLFRTKQFFLLIYSNKYDKTILLLLTVVKTINFFNRLRRFTWNTLHISTTHQMLRHNIPSLLVKYTLILINYKYLNTQLTKSSNRYAFIKFSKNLFKFKFE